MARGEDKSTATQELVGASLAVLAQIGERLFPKELLVENELRTQLQVIRPHVQQLSSRLDEMSTSKLGKMAEPNQKFRGRMKNIKLQIAGARRQVARLIRRGIALLALRVLNLVAAAIDLNVSYVGLRRAVGGGHAGEIAGQTMMLVGSALTTFSAATGIAVEVAGVLGVASPAWLVAAAGAAPVAGAIGLALAVIGLLFCVFDSESDLARTLRFGYFGRDRYKDGSDEPSEANKTKVKLAKHYQLADETLYDVLMASEIKALLTFLFDFELKIEVEAEAAVVTFKPANFIAYQSELSLAVEMRLTSGLAQIPVPGPGQPMPLLADPVPSSRADGSLDTWVFTYGRVDGLFGGAVAAEAEVSLSNEGMICSKSAWSH